jgi:hypothetical protein
MPLSRIVKALTVQPHPGHPWAIHVYGPALRRNPDHLEDIVPVWAVHNPADNYRSFFLVEGFHGLVRAKYDLDRPLPAGIGGSVVAALYCDHHFGIHTSDPWNWVDGRPPIVTITDTMSKADLYHEVIRVYSRRNRG